jgi:hypothetical protein
MGNRLPFLKRRRNEDEPSDQPVEKEASVSPRIAAAGPITREPHTHRPLDQGQLHVHSLPTATPATVNVSSVAEPKEVSDQPDETRTLEGAEQSQVAVLHMETDVPVPDPGTATNALGCCPSISGAVPGEDGSRRGHSPRTGEDGSSGGTGKTGHSTRTKRKHKTVTRKRQHGELRLVASLFLFVVY